MVQELCRWRRGYFRFEVAPVASEGEIGVDAEDLEWALLEAGLSRERDLLEERMRAFELARGVRP